MVVGRGRLSCPEAFHDEDVLSFAVIVIIQLGGEKIKPLGEKNKHQQGRHIKQKFENKIIKPDANLQHLEKNPNN